MNLNHVWLACVPLYTSRQSSNQNGHPRHHPVSGMVVCHAKPKTWLWLSLLSLSFSVAATIPFCLDVDFLFFRTDLKGLLWASIEFVDYFVCVLLLFCIYIYFTSCQAKCYFFLFISFLFLLCFLLDCSICVIQSDFFDDTCSFFSSYCLEQSSLPPPPPSILLFPFPSGTSLSLCFY